VFPTGSDVPRFRVLEV